MLNFNREFPARLIFRRNSFLFCLAFLSLSPVILYGQDIVRDVAAPEKETRAGEATTKIAKKAKERRLVEGLRPISYDEILQRPDDIDLNFQYAKQQVANGDVLGASATLERILMIEPDLHQVRLFYAIVLYRLDNLKEAERELQSLVGLEMPEGLKRDLETYLHKIHLSRKSTRLTMRQSLGYEIDTNRNSAPSSKHNLISDVATGVEGTSRKRRDTSFINVTNVRVTHDPGFQDGHEVSAAFTYFLQEQTMVDNLDLATFRGDLGGAYKSVWMNIRPNFYMNHLYLSRETFLRSQGVSVDFDRSFMNGRFTLRSAAQYEYQDYLNITDSSTAVERKGPQMDYRFGVDYVLLPTLRLSFDVSFTDKEAKQGFNAYQGFNFGPSVIMMLGRGQFLVQSVEAGFEYYDKVDTSIASRHRHDKTLRYRTTYGLPLKAIPFNKLLPPHLMRPLDFMIRDVTLTLTFEYYRAVSTITNNTYKNFKYQGMVTKAWEF
ncbi:MAG: hypothetical protein A2Z83_06325 [Omnitrophica bacterium GWA2_52_8]|nr:MAG: hypothetical protein A2Z83_06325 [Omnitrophica bacterium GWA2_52_8]